MPSRLRVSSHPAAAWAEVVEPWLRAEGAQWRERRAVLAPNAVWLAALKGGAVAAGLPVFGVEWHTPGRWRAQALAALPGPARRVALREDLHLLLELAAANLPNNPLARAYAADAAPFQEWLDALENAGWNADALPDAHARELAHAAEKLRAQAGVLTAAAADRILREAAAAKTLPRLGDKLLVVGFGPGDWPLATLLETACAAYSACDFVLDAPENSVEREAASAAWVGRWEEIFAGPAEWLEAPVETPAPFAPLAMEVAEPVRTPAASAKFSRAKPPPPIVWLADNLQAEADLAVAQALAFLCEDNDARVGVVVGSAASPLAREIAARLAALGCPHYDATGHLPGRTAAQQLFEAWLDWQEDGRLAGVVAWVRAAGRLGLLEEKNAAAIERSLREAAQALLTDDPAPAAAWLEAAAVESLEARAFLRAWPRLPESARWEEFLEKTLAVSAKLHWPAEPEALAQRAQDGPGKLAAKVPRAAVLRWVRAVTRVPGRTRAALGREPWARLQIVDAAGATAQTWTHLVLGGLQHGEWPADRRDSPLLDDAWAEKLNRDTLRQGPHGEGHWTVAPGRGLLLTIAQARRLDRANFARLLGLPARGLALTARLADPADGRPARISEYFWAVARAMLGRLPAEEDWRALADSSRRRREEVRPWLDQNYSTPLAAESRAAPASAKAAQAFRLRRDESVPFDEFSFCLRAAPAAPLRLSCKAWEQALAQPGASWFKHLLRAEPRWRPAEEDAARLARGIWAHECVKPVPANTPESCPLPALAAWKKFSNDTAEKLRAAAAAAFSAAGRPLPEAWLDTHAEAVRLAERWVAELAGLADWPHAFAEISLPGHLRVALPGFASPVPLRGKLDWVLVPRPAAWAKLAGAPAWLFDFKSGADQPLSLSRLAQGDGLQLALYARALLALGAETVVLTLLNAAAGAAAQLESAQLDAPELAPLWRLLADFAERAQWGERCDLEDPHARAGNYPGATLPVPVEILRRKWRRTHGEAAE